MLLFISTPDKPEHYRTTLSGGVKGTMVLHKLNALEIEKILKLLLQAFEYFTKACGCTCRFVRETSPTSLSKATMINEW